VPGVLGRLFVAAEECNWPNGLGDEDRMSVLELDPWWLRSSLREWENERELFDEYARLGSVEERVGRSGRVGTAEDDVDGAENKALP
jgi:hypothetical protein